MSLPAVRGAEQLAAVLAIWADGAVPVLGGAKPGHGDWRGTGALWAWPSSLLRDGNSVDTLTAFVHRSSGSSGTPRYARRSAASLLREAEGYRCCYRIRAGERAYVAAGIEHSFAFGAAFALLSASAEVELAPLFSPRGLVQRLTGDAADIVILTPMMARLALQAASTGARPERPARCVIAGAGAVSDVLNGAFERRFGVPISRNYGATETGATLGLDHHAGERVIGTPFAGVRILAPSLAGRGELVLDLGTEILGYEDAVPIDRKPESVWYTGDVVTVREDGLVSLEGRLDDRVKVNGRLVDLAAVARAASGVAGVREAVALAVSRPGHADTLVVVCEGAAALAERIASAVWSVAEDAATVRMLPILPRTSAGKPDRARLRRMLVETAPA